MAEKRTYATKHFIEDLESLVSNNFNLGDADRSKVAALEALVSHELRVRRENEGRALNNNSVDDHFQSVVEHLRPGPRVQHLVAGGKPGKQALIVRPNLFHWIRRVASWRG